VQLVCAAVAYGELSSGEFRLFTRLDGILAIRVVVHRHTYHNRNIPSTSNKLSQIATCELDDWVAFETGPLGPIARRATNLSSVVQLDLRGLAILALDGIVHLAAMNRYFARGLDPEPNLVAAHVDDGYDDIIANDNTFVALSGEDEHGTSMIGNRQRRTLQSCDTITT